MKNKQTILVRGSFALLLFVILGYVVKFYPDQLRPFDEPIQAAVRGDLPASETSFFTLYTQLVRTSVVVGWAGLLAVIFATKRWWAEVVLLLGNLAAAGLLVVVLKNIYQRPRPSILHLVEEHGFSFPSGHSLAATLVFGSLVIISHHRIKDKLRRRAAEGLFALMIALILLSRVYLGVHYPTDVLGGLILGVGVLHLEYPFYDQWRFKLRFRGKAQ